MGTLLRSVRRSGQFGLTALYLAVSAGLGLVGWRLQHTVFHPPPPPGEMYAAVFVRDPAAHVSLSAVIEPDRPWDDSLAVTVKDAPPGESGWLLVIECPGNVPPQARTVPLYSYAAAVPQAQSAVVYSGTGSSQSGISFGCFRAGGNPPGQPAAAQYSPSLANVSVAALQLDQGMTGAQGLPVLYAVQGGPGGTISQLAQVFPGVSCPPAAPSPSHSAPSESSLSASPSPPSASPSPSPPSTSPPSTSPPSASPSPSPSPANPGCLHLAPPGARSVPYGLPGTVTTAETLSNVDATGYQISMFPTGNTMGESIQWTAQSALDLNFSAANTAAENDANRNIFISGILFGILGGTAVAGADHLFEGFRTRKDRPAHHSIRL